MIWQMDDKWLEKQITSQCAPLLAGLKPSNLLTIPKWAGAGLRKAFSGTELFYYCMAEHGDKQVYLVYQREELLCYLRRTEVREMLEKLGYEEEDLDSLLWNVSLQYGAHLSEGSAFPHELGLLLGYPVVDVQGFMENEGKNFLYSGYWKVYGNLAETVHLFYEFGQAKKLVAQLFSRGYAIADIVNNRV